VALTVEKVPPERHFAAQQADDLAVLREVGAAVCALPQVPSYCLRLNLGQLIHSEERQPGAHVRAREAGFDELIRLRH
jgi:hypothetical protein